VVEGPDGKLHMVVSVGNEVWAGAADHPLGPWRDALGGRPLIPENFRPGFHMIDAEYFLDDDGQAYLYWGSGHNWKNGRCWAVKLKPDMVTFDGEVKDVTPANYFEAPFMVKRHGLYFLMYSAGNTMKEDYRVHYAVGRSPFGPFFEGPESPILVTDEKANVVSPGHHAVFRHEDRDYILYHRHSIPRNHGFMGRQVCVDPLNFTADGRIERVVPKHRGPPLAQGRLESLASISAGATASASSEDSAATSAACVLDGNYATRWAAARDAKGAWLMLDLGAEKSVTRQVLRPEYAWKSCRFTVEASSDGKTWLTLANYLKEPAIGSPIEIAKPVTARYLRIVFPEDVPGSAISLFVWAVQ